MKDVFEFLRAIQKTPETMKMLKETKGELELEEAVKVYAEAAKKTGIDVSEKTILRLLKAKEIARKKATEKAQGLVNAALEEKDLESVAGGDEGDQYGGLCDDTYTSGEWCWFNDSCEYVISYYNPDDVEPENNGTETSCPNEALLYYMQKELSCSKDQTTVCVFDDDWI